MTVGMKAAKPCRQSQSRSRRSRALPLNQPVTIDFTPRAAGELTFVCGMNMLRGAVVVRPAHRQLRPGFIDTYQTVGIDRPDPPAEGAPGALDVGPVLLGRPGPFFLTTYPARCNARHTVHHFTRALRETRRLYSSVSSPHVASGWRASNCFNSGTSTRDAGPRRPPAARPSPSPGIARSTAAAFGVRRRRSSPPPPPIGHPARTPSRLVRETSRHTGETCRH